MIQNSQTLIDLNNQLSQAQENSEQGTEEIVLLMQEITDTENLISQINNDIADKQLVIASLETDLDQMNNQKTQLSQNIQTLINQISVKESSIIQIQSSIQSTSDAITSLWEY